MILVTGGTGFIGRHLLERLSAEDEPARCLLRRTRTPRRLPAGIEPVFGDLASGEGVAKAIEGADAVIHLAGVTKALRPADYYTGNVRATKVLLGALAGSPARLVHVSSMAAIGPGRDGVPVAEDAEPHPLTHYGRSKLEAERIVRAVAPEAVIIRPPVVYGPGDTDVFQILRSVSRGLVVEISGGERWFSAIYVEDLADALLSAARSTLTARTWFLAHPKPATWRQLEETAARIMGRRPRTLRVPLAAARAVGYCAELWSYVTRKPGIVSREKVREAECPFWVCDTHRAAAELGFEAPTGLEAGLARTLEWYRRAGWLRY